MLRLLGATLTRMATTGDSEPPPDGDDSDDESSQPRRDEGATDEPRAARGGADWEKVWKLLASLPDRRPEMLAVLDGAIGDRLQSTGSSLALPMTLLADRKVLDLGKDLGPQIPNATGCITVYIHGLMATENVWSYPAGKTRSFGDRLAADEGVTPVYLRYNTGVHISTNGRQLAILLQELVDAWPVPVTEINLMAHSMGGLVARSACHYGSEGRLAWISLVHRVFLIAAPLRGVSMEQLANLATVTLSAIPTPPTWLLAWLFKQRSDGIKDLRHGYLVDEEWEGKNQDRLTLGRRLRVPLLEGVQHYVAAGMLLENAPAPLSQLIGDALVAPFSAKDEAIDGSPLEGAVKGARVFPGLGHNALISNDEVYAQVLDWWRCPPPSRLKT